MKEFPKNVVAYKRTSLFTQKTVPDALLKRHTTKAGSWTKIRVRSGQLKYITLLAPLEEYKLTPGSPGIVEPQVAHQGQLHGSIEFDVEFYRVAEL